MRIKYVWLFLILTAGQWAAAHQPSTSSSKASDIIFWENKGQWPEQVLFKAELSGLSVWIEKECVTYHLQDLSVIQQAHDHTLDTSKPAYLKHHVYKTHFVNGSTKGVEKGIKAKHFRNYFLGKDQSKWNSEVKGYNQLILKNIWPSIDIKYFSKNGQLKYDVIVNSGAKTADIKLAYEGIKPALHQGHLELPNSIADSEEEAPFSYQGETEISSSYRLENDTLRFEIGSYDRSEVLIVDPTLLFSTFSGSTTINFGYTATFDAQGFLYSGGTVFNTGYPTTIGAYQSAFLGPATAGLTDIGISKYDTTGSTLIYSTYLGGSSSEQPHSLVVNSQGELYVMGTTSSLNYPTTFGAADTGFNFGPAINLTNGLGINFPNGVDLFVSRFNVTGTSLLSSTYIGGSGTDGLNLENNTIRFNYGDQVRGEILTDNQDRVYVASCTRSTDFPFTNTTIPIPPFNSGLNGVAVRMPADLTTFEHSIIYGGSGADAFNSIALNNDGRVFLAGGTTSSNLNGANNTLQTGYQGGISDGFVVILDDSLQNLIDLTYWGTTGYDQTYFVDLDGLGYPHLFGQTTDTGTFYINNTNYNTPQSGQYISKLTPGLDTVIWSTAFGTGSGAPNISPTAFLVDVCNSIYFSGWGSNIEIGSTLTTTGMDTTAGAFQTTTDGNDFYLGVISDDGDSLLYGSFYGGANNTEHVDGGTSRFDKKGKVYQSVCADCNTGANTFPVTPNAHSINAVNGCSNGVFKVDFLLDNVIAEFAATNPVCLGDTVFTTNFSQEQNASNYLWNFGNGDTSSLKTPAVLYNQLGEYTIELVITDTSSCNFSDTLRRVITVRDDSTFNLVSSYACPMDSVQLGFGAIQNYTYQWSPGHLVSDSTISAPFALVDTSITYQLIANNTVCLDTYNFPLALDTAIVSTNADTMVCSQTGGIFLTANTNAPLGFYVWSKSPTFADTINTNLFNPNLIGILTPFDSATSFYLKFQSLIGCITEDTVTVDIYDRQFPINADFSAPAIGCVPFQVNFTNNSDTALYTKIEWAFGDGSSSTSYSPSHTYNNSDTVLARLIVEDTAVCPRADTAAIQIILIDDTTFSKPPLLACENDVVLIGESFIADSNVSYEWFPTAQLTHPDSSETFAVAISDTTYLLTIDYSGLCADSIFHTINIDEIDVSITSDTIVCSDNFPLQLTANSNGAANQYTWRNQNGSVLQQTSDSLYSAVFFGARGRFSVRANTTIGCADSATINLKTADLAAFASGDGLICNDDTAALLITDTLGVNLNYEWYPVINFLDPISSPNPRVNPSISQTYFVDFTQPQINCTGTDTVIVKVSQLLPTDITTRSDKDTIVLGETVQLDADFSGNYTFQWTPDRDLTAATNPSTQAQPTQTTTYTAQITEGENEDCLAISEKIIVVFELKCDEPGIYVPNGFTPNGDGNNDILRVRALNIDIMEFSIYNRWGQRVFYTEDQSEGWNGTFNNEQLSPDVYVYQLRVVCIDGQETFLKGNISLL